MVLVVRMCVASSYSMYQYHVACCLPANKSKLELLKHARGAGERTDRLQVFGFPFCADYRISAASLFRCSQARAAGVFNLCATAMYSNVTLRHLLWSMANKFQNRKLKD